MNEKRDVDGICGCGRVLYVCYDESGKRIGVTHLEQDDTDHHELYWIGAYMEIVDGKPTIASNVDGGVQ